MNREDVQTWCLDKGFELVELNPVEEDYDLGNLCFILTFFQDTRS